MFHFKRDATLRRYDGRRWAPHLDGEPDGKLHPLPVSLLTVMDPPIISQKRERWLKGYGHPGGIAITYAGEACHPFNRLSSPFSPSFPLWQKCRFQSQTCTKIETPGGF